MLEWAAEQTAEMTTELINRELLLTATNQERGVHTSYEAKTLLPTRGRTQWKHGGGCRSDLILQQEEAFLRDVALFWNSKRELNAGSPSCRATRRS